MLFMGGLWHDLNDDNMCVIFFTVHVLFVHFMIVEYNTEDEMQSVIIFHKFSHFHSINWRIFSQSIDEEVPKIIIDYRGHAHKPLSCFSPIQIIVVSSFF